MYEDILLNLLKNINLFKVKSCLYIRIPKTASTSLMRKFKIVNNSSGVRLNQLIYTNLNDRLFNKGLDWSNNQLIEFEHNIPTEVFQNLYKFSFVRNPFDRAVSAWAYMQRRRYIRISKKYKLNNCTFVDFWKRVQDSQLNFTDPEQWDDLTWHLSPMYIHLINQQNKLGIDFIGKVENIKSDFNKVCKHLNANKIVNLPVLRKTNHRKPQDYYTNETIEIVSKLYERDFKEFQYNTNIQ